MTCWNLPTAAETSSSLWRPRMEEVEEEVVEEVWWVLEVEVLEVVRNLAGARQLGRPTLLASLTAGWELANTEPS